MIVVTRARPRQDVEAAAFSYTQLRATPAADDSTSARKRVACDIDTPPVKDAPAKKRK